MTKREALDLTRSLKISESEDSLVFKAAIIFWLGVCCNFDPTKTAEETGYKLSDVNIVLDNWKKNEILVDGVIYADFGNEETDWMELILVCMCGSGDIVRVNDSNKFQIKTENKMGNTKTLNEHLFAQLERLSEADESSIKTEMDKAANIVMVSEQILKVARLKLDIMQAAVNVGEFSEIDSVKSLPEGGDVKKN